MSRKYKIHDQSKLYFVTFTVIHWLDVFTRAEYKDIIIESLKYCQAHKGLELCAFCIMTSHVHLIIGRNGEPALEHIIRDIKKYTSVRLVEAIQNNPQESRRELCGCSGALEKEIQIIRIINFGSNIATQWNWLRTK